MSTAETAAISPPVFCASPACIVYHRCSRDVSYMLSLLGDRGGVLTILLKLEPNVNLESPRGRHSFVDEGLRSIHALSLAYVMRINIMVVMTNVVIRIGSEWRFALFRRMPLTPLLLYGFPYR